MDNSGLHIPFIIDQLEIANSENSLLDINFYWLNIMFFKDQETILQDDMHSLSTLFVWMCSIKRIATSKEDRFGSSLLDVFILIALYVSLVCWITGSSSSTWQLQGSPSGQTNFWKGRCLVQGQINYHILHSGQASNFLNVSLETRRTLVFLLSPDRIYEWYFLRQLCYSIT